MISTKVHNKGKFINEFMFCTTELKTFRTFHRRQNYNMIKPHVWNTTGSPGSMLAVRIDSNLRQCMRIYSIYFLNVIFSKNINKTDLPCVWCCVCFCLCAFEAILKRFRRLLIFHVDSPELILIHHLKFESILTANIEPGLPVGTQDTMTVPFLFQLTKYVFFPDEKTRLSLL